MNNQQRADFLADSLRELGFDVERKDYPRPTDDCGARYYVIVRVDDGSYSTQFNDRFAAERFGTSGNADLATLAILNGLLETYVS